MDEEDETENDAIAEFITAEQEWKDVSFPSEDEFKKIWNDAILLRKKMSQLENSQPKCWILGENYDREFSVYKAEVEEEAGRNRRALRLLIDSSRLEQNSANLQETIERLRELRKENRLLWPDVTQDYAKSVISLLETRKKEFNQLNKNELEKVKLLTKGFEDNNATLAKLIKPTHEWKAIERETVIIESEWIPPSDSSMEPKPRKEKQFVTKNKCTLCGKEQKGNLAIEKLDLACACARACSCVEVYIGR